MEVENEGYVYGLVDILCWYSVQFQKQLYSDCEEACLNVVKNVEDVEESLSI